MQIVSIRLLAALFIYFSGNATASIWIYKNPLLPDKEHVLIVDTPKEITLNGHKTVSWYPCKDTKYICVMSGLIALSVPKNTESKNDWTINGVDYSIVVEKDLSILGQKIPNVILIRATFPQDSSYNQEFLFSYDRGLLAFIERSNGTQSFLILEGMCGFGAAEECENR